MADTDKFVSDTHPLGQPSGATRPLAAPPPPRPPVPGHVVQAQLTDVIGKLKQALDTHRPSVELLLEACGRARLPLPGVANAHVTIARTAKGEEIVVYLVRRVGEDPKLGRTVQVVVFRFYDASGGVIQAVRALDAHNIPQPMVAQLRLKLHHLMHIHLEFKHEPVLRQIFPGPRTVPPPPPMSNAQRMKAKIKFENALHKAEALMVSLEPVMGAVAEVLKSVEGPGGPNLLALIDKSQRDACLVAIGLGPDEEAKRLLREGLANFGQLRQAVVRAREKQEATGLEAAAFPLAGFRHACLEHSVLRTLFSNEPQIGAEPPAQAS